MGQYAIYTNVMWKLIKPAVQLEWIKVGERLYLNICVFIQYILDLKDVIFKGF